MKRIILVSLALAAIWLYGCAMSSQTYVERQEPYPAFNSLDSYGRWINVPGLGTVWRPYDENNWQPYANGHWVWTNDGWMWDSYEPYGWVVYHYGYWQFDNYYGWVWLPSYDWQPARVVWYHSGGYVGWAPLPPPGIDHSTYFDRPNVRVWVIVHENNFIDRDVVKFRTRSVTPDIQAIRSRDGGRAPDVRNIEQVTHRTIDAVRPVREDIRTGGRDLVRVRVGNNRSGNQRNRTEPNPPAVLPVRPPAGRVEPPANTKSRTEPVNKGIPPNRIERNPSNRTEPVRNESGEKVIRKQEPNNTLRKEPARRIEPVKKETVKKPKVVKQKPPAKKQNESKRGKKIRKEEKRNNNGRN